MKKTGILFLTVFMLLIVTACTLLEGTLITSQESPNGDYTVHLYQTGSPDWPFGGVEARLVLENSEGDTVDDVEFELANDGGGVYEGNIEEVHWQEDKVEIIMSEADTTKQHTYVLNYHN